MNLSSDFSNHHHLLYCHFLCHHYVFWESFFSDGCLIFNYTFYSLSETLLFISNPHICPRFPPPWRSNFSSGWNVEDGSLKLPDRPADRWSTRPVLAWMDLPLGYAPRGIFTHSFILPLIRKGFFNLCLVLIVKDHLAIHLLIGSEVSWINT